MNTQKNIDDTYSGYSSSNKIIKQDEVQETNIDQQSEKESDKQFETIYSHLNKMEISKITNEISDKTVNVYIKKVSPIKRISSIKGDGNGDRDGDNRGSNYIVNKQHTINFNVEQDILFSNLYNNILQNKYYCYDKKEDVFMVKVKYNNGTAFTTEKNESITQLTKQILRYYINIGSSKYCNSGFSWVDDRSKNDYYFDKIKINERYCIDLNKVNFVVNYVHICPYKFNLLGYTENY